MEQAQPKTASHPSAAASDGVRRKRTPEEKARLMESWLDEERTLRHKEQYAKRLKRRVKGKLSPGFGLIDEDFDNGDA